MPSRPLPGFDRTVRFDREPGLNRPEAPTRFKKRRTNTGLIRVIQENRVNSPSHDGGDDHDRFDLDRKPPREFAATPASPFLKEPGSPGSPGSDQQISGFERTGSGAEPGSTRFKPANGGLVARLCEAGATVRRYIEGQDCKAEIVAPADLPRELLAEIEAKGWQIIPGGKANPAAEHDSWLAGVPFKEFDR